MFRLALVALTLLLAACEQAPQKPAFQATDITGAPWGKNFALTDQNGKPRSLADFQGKLVTLFFGYLHCPDVCPTTLADLAAARKLLGAEADKLQVIFVTLDPERDTPELLRPYLAQFDPSFLALRGDAAATAQIARDFKIHYAKNPGKEGRYTLDHSTGTFVFDKQGRIRLLLAYGTQPEAIAADLKTLLKQ